MVDINLWRIREEKERSTSKVISTMKLMPASLKCRLMVHKRVEVQIDGKTHHTNCALADTMRVTLIQQRSNDFGLTDWISYAITHHGQSSPFTE